MAATGDANAATSFHYVGQVEEPADLELALVRPETRDAAGTAWSMWSRCASPAGARSLRKVMANEPSNTRSRCVPIIAAARR